MPLLNLETTVSLNDIQKKSVPAGLSQIIAGTTGKPEKYVMVAVNQASILMGGKGGDAAFVDIRGIGGLDADVNRKLSEAICRFLTQSLGMPSERIYLNFTDIPAKNWGWNGTTFA